ncbi:MAG TPA: hypothetical protein VF748_14570 [Candidatus Acidoferrum sp.]
MDATRTTVTPGSPPTSFEELFLKLGMPSNRWLAHQVLFKKRHPDQTPPFHIEMIQLWHSTAKRVLTMAFREGGKSTVAEEAIVLGAALQLFHNCLILGADQERAIDRLRAVKNEFVNNDILRDLFGDLVGPIWNEGRIILANNVCIQAYGKNQVLRGIKYLQWRPDFCFLDDIEDREDVRDPPTRQELMRWFMAVVIPALDKDAKIRIAATPLDRDSLPMKLSRRPEWVTKTYPIESFDPQGNRVPTWPARYPLNWIDARKKQLHEEGLEHDFMREYMCVAEDESQKIFTRDLLIAEPHTHSWQPTYAFYDPARTVGPHSSTTGWAVWSWVGDKLIVWDGGGELWRPDELRDHIFALDEKYHPIMIGIEQTGLNEFLLQPLRLEMIRRGCMIPIAPFDAPRGKHDFIKGLQPFFKGGHVRFAQELPVLWAQFLSFPTGRIDGPNALAYALRMRPGAAIYTEFSTGHVAEDAPLGRRGKLFLCLNATRSTTTAVLVQYHDGGLYVVRDYVREADPSACVYEIIQAAQLDAAGLGASTQDIVLCAGLEHFAALDTIGLRGAVAKVPAQLQRAGTGDVGRAEIRELLARRRADVPLLRVSAVARWTLNGFCGGFSKRIERSGLVAEEPRAGIYATLMGGLEAFAGLLKVGINTDDMPTNYQYTKDGRRFISALPGQQLGTTPDRKGQWLRGPE